jgi:hypothetical protein
MQRAPDADKAMDYRLAKPDTVFGLCIGLALPVEINPSQVSCYGTDWRRARVVKNLPNDVDCAAGIDGSTSVEYHLPCIFGRQHLENSLQNGNVLGTRYRGARRICC